MSERKLSRRSILQHVAAGASASVLAGPIAARAFTKSPQKAARYQNYPNGSQRCGTCLQFLAPSSCKVVAGRISPNGWCALYGPKPG